MDLFAVLAESGLPDDVYTAAAGQLRAITREAEAGRLLAETVLAELSHQPARVVAALDGFYTAA